jgi:hypothetical protein
LWDEGEGRRREEGRGGREEERTHEVASVLVEAIGHLRREVGVGKRLRWVRWRKGYTSKRFNRKEEGTVSWVEPGRGRLARRTESDVRVPPDRRTRVGFMRWKGEGRMRRS